MVTAGPALKVLAYVTRVREGVLELLVHQHRDAPEAGIQVPAGSVEEDEEIESAVVRELAEETGIRDATMVGCIDVYEWLNPATERWQRRHVYHLSANGTRPDHWLHRVSGVGEDQDMFFVCRWMPIGEAERALCGDQGRSICKISREL